MVGSFITDDISSLLGTDDFSMSTTYTPVGGSPTTVAGVFDDEDVEVDQNDSRFIQRSAKFTCASASVTGLVKGDAFTINAVSYTVAFFKDDGTGVVEIYMELV
jgi:hypothetical protein